MGKPGGVWIRPAKKGNVLESSAPESYIETMFEFVLRAVY
jgi:hypothetical protein